MAYQILDDSDTIVEVVEGSTSQFFKKVGCSTIVRGNYLIFLAAVPEKNIFNVQYQILYSDCTSPSAGSASALKTAVDAILDSYAGGGGGGESINTIMAHIAAY